MSDAVAAPVRLAGSMLGPNSHLCRTHQMIIVGGTIQENPFFVPAAQFLQERRADSTHAPPS